LGLCEQKIFYENVITWSKMADFQGRGIKHLFYLCSHTLFFVTCWLILFPEGVMKGRSDPLQVPLYSEALNTVFPRIYNQQWTLTAVPSPT
jgi:hypothetical protein